jgi:hypothetical protein
MRVTTTLLEVVAFGAVAGASASFLCFPHISFWSLSEVVSAAPGFAGASAVVGIFTRLLVSVPHLKAQTSQRAYSRRRGVLAHVISKPNLAFACLMALFFVALIPEVNQARDAARRMRCTNIGSDCPLPKEAPLAAPLNAR